MVAPLLLLGAVTALDGTSVGQFMISRPLVSGTLAGCLIGDPGTGLLLGAILEGADLGTIPAGGVRFMEPGPAAIPAVVAALSLGGGGGIAVGALIGVAMAFLGGETIVVLRRMNGAIAQRVLEGEGSRRELIRGFWSCIVLDGIRGLLLTVAGLALALAIPGGVAALWKLDATVTATVFLLPALLAGGILLDRWRLTARRWAIFALAVGCGVALGGVP